MSNAKEIKAIQDTIAQAQEQLAQLQAAEVTRQPKAWDVWEQGNCLHLITNDERMVALDPECYRSAETYHHYGLGKFGTFLGTHDEVFIARSEIEKEYVSNDKYTAAIVSNDSEWRKKIEEEYVSKEFLDDALDSQNGEGRKSVKDAIIKTIFDNNAEWRDVIEKDYISKDVLREWKDSDGDSIEDFSGVRGNELMKFLRSLL